jgi:CRISPR-associated protein (TIGR03986 family)
MSSARRFEIMHFVNPYHFIPVNENIPKCIDAGKTLSAETLGHCTFDRYHEKKLSGRIVCTLETMGQTIIGSDQIKAKNNNDYNHVNPFLRGNHPAIPGSSIRGCISAIAEAASNSALRVLDNSPYSRRTSMLDDVNGRVADYSAMGMIYKEDDDFFLIPLAMPTLESGPNGNYQLPEKYRKLFHKVQLKAYCYSKQTLENAPIPYNNNKQPLFFYAKLKGKKYSMDRQYRITGGEGKEKRTKSGKSILLGYEIDGEPVEKPPENEEHLYTRGILRVIYTKNRKEEMPTKKHELFLPFPDNCNIIPIDKTALETFNRLAEDRDTENKRRIKSGGGDLLPFALKGAQEFKDRSYRLRAGDIVFFEPDETGSKIIKVRVSQLWREEIPHKTHQFFSKINPDLLPFHQGRTEITPAEALFGFVEVNDKGEEIKDDARALASRIRFGEGCCSETEVFHDEIPLRILASPKPPCPSFYFRPRNLPTNPSESVSSNECYISKKDLNPISHRPQGRKFYFNHDIINDILEEAKSKRDENQSLKNKVRPLKKGCRFVFHVDFENLSEWELGLLLFSLNPRDDFYHKIGMGKPLGFGSVQIRPAGVFFIERSKRYTPEGFADAGGLRPRYHQTWVNTEIIKDIQDYLGKHEKAAIKEQCIGNNDDLSPEKLKSLFTRDMADAIRKALFKIGQPNVKDISQPLAIEQNDSEQETFKWFQNNDQTKDTREKQGLVPLEYGADIVKLKKNQKNQNRRA